MTLNETAQALTVPAWWAKPKRGWRKLFAENVPGWLAVDASKVAFAVGDELVFTHTREDVQPRLRWWWELTLECPSGSYRFSMVRPRYTPRPDESDATTASEVLTTVVDRIGPSGPGGLLFGGLDILDQASETVSGINDCRSGYRNAKRVMALLTAFDDDQLDVPSGAKSP
jgi:hypothetical protein